MTGAAGFGAVRFAYTVVYVRDIDATLAFYTDGLGLPVRFVHESGRYAELDTGDVTLAFTEESLARTVVPSLPGGFRVNRRDDRPPGFDLAFSTDDVGAAVDRARAAGAVVVEPPGAKPWGQQVAYLRDPDGLLIEIGTPVDQAHPGPSRPRS